jgi:hypothetical protein
MRLKNYIITIAISLLSLLIVAMVFFNDWILKHDVPSWLRTAVYLTNPPDDLRNAIQFAEIIEGSAGVDYINEYYGNYSVYIANDISGRDYVELKSDISYKIICKGDAKYDVNGKLGYLPQSIFIYSVPIDVPINGKLSCTIRVDSQESGKLYVLINKLFDV